MHTTNALINSGWCLSGRIIGKAICDAVYLDIHFTRSFYKHILNQTIVYNDLETADPEYFKSLEILLAHPLVEIGMDETMTFSVETQEFGQLITKDLIPDGRNIFVTDENKADYVRLVALHRMSSEIEKQIGAFKDGFYELVPSDLIELFDAQELELLISGLPDIGKFRKPYITLQAFKFMAN